MIEFLERNGHSFDDSEQDEVAEMIERLAASEVSEEDFAAWVSSRCRAASVET